MYTLACNKETWDEYEKQKDYFLDEIYSKAEARAVARKKKDDKLLEHINPGAIQGLTGRELAIYDAYKTKGKKQSEIAEELGLTQSRISGILVEIDNKLKNQELKN